MNRTYKIITGVAYPVLFNGKNQPTRVAANLTDPNDYYYDDGIRLSEKDMAAYKGKPICVDHDTSKRIGEIANVWKGEDGKMWMQARIFTDSQSGLDWYDRINRGDLSNLSVGYSVNTNPNSGEVVNKEYHEISVCETGFFPGAEIRVAATGEKKYNTNGAKLYDNLVFSVMATETNSSAAAATPALPLDTRNKDASELARAGDALLKEQEKNIARMKQLEEENARLKKLEEDRLLKYANDRKPLAEEVLKIEEERFKEENPDTPLPSDYRESVLSAFMNPDAAPSAAVIAASAMSYKKNRDVRLAQKAQFEDMEKKVKQLEEQAEVAKMHVMASERLHLATGGAAGNAAAAPTASVTVNAARPASNIFLPSEHEKQLLKDNYGMDASKIKVNAAASEYVDSAPVQLRKHLPNSLFANPHGSKNANWLRDNMDKFNSARTAGTFVPKTEKVAD